jgi:hypothetical protein
MENVIDRKRRFCPMMKEMCVNGHTKSMGEYMDGEQNICRFWTHIAGKDPQSERMLDQWDCSLAWMPMLMIENAQMTRQVVASVDRNNNTFFAALPPNVQNKITSQSSGMRNLLNEKSENK